MKIKLDKDNFYLDGESNTEIFVEESKFGLNFSGVSDKTSKEDYKHIVNNISNIKINSYNSKDKDAYNYKGNKSKVKPLIVGISAMLFYSYLEDKRLF